jgi:hypothetical protein
MALKKEKFSQNLAAGALTFTSEDKGKDTKLSSVRLKFSIAVTQTVTVTLVDSADANYDVVLARESLVGATSYVFIPPCAGGVEVHRDDRIKVEVTNTATPAAVAYGSVVQFQ